MWPANDANTIEKMIPQSVLPIQQTTNLFFFDLYFTIFYFSISIMFV